MKVSFLILFVLVFTISCKEIVIEEELENVGVTPTAEQLQKALDAKYCLDNKDNTPFAGGDGSSSDPYKICTVSHFNEVASSVSYLSNHFELYADLDFSSVSLDPIGANPGGFAGTFDGRNYELSNVDISEGGIQYVGVFRRMETTAEVRNLTLKNLSVVGSHYTGGLAGYSGGLVENVHVTGTSSVSGGNNTGGIVGRVWVGSTAEGVYNSSTNATITGAQWTGGLVGWSRGATYDGNSATGDVSGSSRSGGLLGVADGTTLIKNSYATGDVTGSSFMIGGLVGGINGVIEDSYATGNVNTGGNWSGGLVGTLQGHIRRSYSTSNVTNASAQSIGGIAGYVYSASSISNCYYTGAIVADSSVGGIAGYTDGSPITYSYSTGAITATSAGGLQGGSTSAVSVTSFWDTDTSGISGDYIDGGITLSAAQGRTTSQMQSASLYIGAGFDASIWNISDGSYPTLK